MPINTYPLILIVIMVLPSLALAEEDDLFKVSGAAHSEQYERKVDEVASSAQENAISRLSAALKKYHGTHQEPLLLSRLAELQQQDASIRFRIAHGKAHQSHGKLDLTSYRRVMQQSIATLTQLIHSYPDYHEIAHAYFMRGKACEEIDAKAFAKQDYLYLVKNFPRSEEADSAYMSLAEFAIDAGDHAKAITYLKEVEKDSNDPHYPFALYKLSWAYYNLRNIHEALSYAERLSAFYGAKKKDQGGKLYTSDEALRENVLTDATVFFFDGYEQGITGYEIDRAFSYFTKLESGPLRGKMLLKYAKLLRSHGHDHDLIEWKDLFWPRMLIYPKDWMSC